MFSLTILTVMGNFVSQETIVCDYKDPPSIISSQEVKAELLSKIIAKVLLERQA